MKGSRYSPLHQAHERIRKEREPREAMMELTERREKRDAPRAAHAEEKAASSAPPAHRGLSATDQAAERAAEAQARNAPASGAARPDPGVSRYIAVPEGPAPNESQQHYAWRTLQTARVQRDRERETTREADRIPRILRTETDPVRRKSELNAADAKHETEHTDRDRRTARKAKAPEVSTDKEPEREE